MKLKGRFDIEIFSKEGVLLKTLTIPNGIVNEGKDHILDTQFHGGTPVDPWYIGLIDNSGGPVLNAADTLASHAGWAEFTNYVGNRKEWDEAAASGQVMSSANPAVFTLSGDGDIAGIFIASVSTGSAGVLWSTAIFEGGVESLLNGAVLKVNYTLEVS